MRYHFYLETTTIILEFSGMFFIVVLITCVRTWDGVSGHTTLKHDTLHIEDFRMKALEKIAATGRSLWPSQLLSPEIDLKTLPQEVPSLFLKGRSILISEDKETLRRIPNKQDLPNSPVYCTCLILFNLLYFSRAVHSSSNLAEKYSGLFLRSSFPMKAPVSYKSYINFYTFLLLIYQFNVQTQTGTQRRWRKYFSSPYLIMTKMLVSTSAILFFSPDYDLKRLLSIGSIISHLCYLWWIFLFGN